METIKPSLENAGLKFILMIEPSCFGYNEQTALNNYFQQNINIENVNTEHKPSKVSKKQGSKKGHN